VAGRYGDRLLRRDRGVPGDLRSAPGPAVDGGADALVCVPAGSGPLPWPVPGAPRRDHAAAWCLAGRHRGGAAGVRTALRATWSAGSWDGLLSAGRTPLAARRVHQGRGGLPPGQPARTGAAARPGPAAAGAETG